MRKCCQREFSLDEVQGSVGHGLRYLVEDLLKKDGKLIDSTDSPESIDTILEVLLTYYRGHSCVLSREYSGISRVLQQLLRQNIKLAVLSNKDDALVQIIVEHYFPKIFQQITGSLPNIPRKPNPSSLLHLLHNWKIAPSESLFVGDSSVDKETAIRAGVDFLAVAWGYEDSEKLSEQGKIPLIYRSSEILEHC